MKSVLCAVGIVFLASASQACENPATTTNLGSCQTEVFTPLMADEVEVHTVSTTSVDPARVAAMPSLPQPDTVVREVAEMK